MTKVASRMLVMAKHDTLPSVDDMAAILDVDTGRVLDAMDGLRLMGYSFRMDLDDEPVRVVARPATIIQGHVEDPRLRELEKENASLRLRLTNQEANVSLLQRKVEDAMAALQRAW